MSQEDLIDRGQRWPDFLEPPEIRKEAKGRFWVAIETTSGMHHAFAECDPADMVVAADELEASGGIEVARLLRYLAQPTGLGHRPTGEYADGSENDCRVRHWGEYNSRLNGNSGVEPES